MPNCRPGEPGEDRSELGRRERHGFEHLLFLLQLPLLLFMAGLHVVKDNGQLSTTPHFLPEEF